GDLDAVAAHCTGATELYVAADAVEADALLQARRLAHPAMERLAALAFPAGNGGLVIDDVAEPRARLVELVEGVARSAGAHGGTGRGAEAGRVGRPVVGHLRRLKRGRHPRQVVLDLALAHRVVPTENPGHDRRGVLGTVDAAVRGLDGYPGTPGEHVVEVQRTF